MAPHHHLFTSFLLVRGKGGGRPKSSLGDSALTVLSPRDITPLRPVSVAFNATDGCVAEGHEYSTLLVQSPYYNTVRPSRLLGHDVDFLRWLELNDMTTLHHEFLSTIVVFPSLEELHIFGLFY
uniref:Uncharacterized protein n=1 Tax=Leersia perrieri TaxID=77586 RepID=A0A0D9WTG8_9ORYZ